MSTPIAPEDIELFKELRLQGVSLREATRRLGREQHSSFYRYDPLRKPKASPAPELEAALVQPIEVALAEAFPYGAEATRDDKPNRHIEAFPKVLEALRGLVSQVMKVMKQGRVPTF